MQLEWSARSGVQVRHSLQHADDNIMQTCPCEATHTSPALQRNGICVTGTSRIYTSCIYTQFLTAARCNIITAATVPVQPSTFIRQPRLRVHQDAGAVSLSFSTQYSSMFFEARFAWSLFVSSASNARASLTRVRLFFARPGMLSIFVHARAAVAVATAAISCSRACVGVILSPLEQSLALFAEPIQACTITTPACVQELATCRYAQS